jgi:hypothetical protein
VAVGGFLGGSGCGSGSGSGKVVAVDKVAVALHNDTKMSVIGAVLAEF